MNSVHAFTHPSVELCVLASLMLVWIGRRGQPSARATSVLAAVFVVLVIVRRGLVAGARCTAVRRRYA